MNDGFKPMLACDWHEDKLKFPLLVQPKIDGVHTINRHGKLLGRSLKPHENKYVTAKFSKPEYHGFCGEMISGTDPSSEDLCRITSGDLRRHTGEPKVTWYLFDYVTEETKNLSYTQRILALEDYVDTNLVNDPNTINMEIIYTSEVNNINELLQFEDQYLHLGYEGVILRDPGAAYKYGRCGKTFMGCWRIKRFIEEEFIVDKIVEGQHNANEATTNELGRTERSTHQENMQPNGLVGGMIGRLLKDVKDPQTGKVLIPKNEEILVSPGKMDHSMRKHYFENQHELLGTVCKFKMFPKGIKDKPRFPTWECIRNANDQ